ncbi:alpha-N-acetylgalactosaminidase-like [Gigantopelta aegis]|uniref:alpha-N-acetylgalactosaminidase-like n=1 Tax=Gigantopelta aegis TaxID=1735272 RepID=UPI001B889BB1|nr:alpha-N-acetylgalactosaminidase-like [Gigantopelta aegis]
MRNVCSDNKNLCLRVNNHHLTRTDFLKSNAGCGDSCVPHLINMLRVVILLTILTTNSGLDNGLALTPPMGWMSWQRFRCNIDCDVDPENCIREGLYKEMADRVVSDGYRDAGYEYISVDDCWSTHERDSGGNLQADPHRFPSGIRELSRYVHSKGLKLGLYGDIGRTTCKLYPGNELHLRRDANTFAEWEIDYLKVDGCHADTNDFSISYPLFGHWLNETGRPILYSCSWPFFMNIKHETPNYMHVAKSCNIWRSYYDIQDSWENVQSIIQYQANITDTVQPAVGPGHFNDPDMLVIGNFGLSYDQEQVHMALWAIMAAPLIMSNDLRHMRDESKAILQNKMAIAVNQDPLGRQGQRIYKNKKSEIWTRQLKDDNVAIAVINLDDGGCPAMIHTTLAGLGLNGEGGYNVTDVFNKKPVKSYTQTDTVTFRPNPSGVEFVVASPLPYTTHTSTASPTLFLYSPTQSVVMALSLISMMA